MSKRTRLAKKAFLIVIAVCICFSAVLTFPANIQATTLQEQLDQIERDLAQIRLDKQNLQQNIDAEKQKAGAYSGEIGKLRAETEKLQVSISELALQIEELNVNIQILNEQIAAKRTEIEDNEAQVLGLEVETNQRISTNYMDYRIRDRTSSDFFTVKDANTYFKDSQYREIIQENTNQVLQELSELKLKLERDKAELEEQQVQSLRDQALLDEQESQLDQSKAELETRMQGYYGALASTQSTINNTQSSYNNISTAEAQKLGERERIRQELFNSFGSIPNGQYVVVGTIIGTQGETGMAFGEHLHFQTQLNGTWRNPCELLPGGGGPNNGGCGGNGSLQWPLHGTFVYTSGFYDPRWYGIHAAVDLANYTSHAPIYAAHNGWLFKGVDQYGALYIVICENQSNCNSGFKTGYWHLSSY